MTKQMDLGGTFTLPGTSMTLNRQWAMRDATCRSACVGPPRDVDGAVAVCERRLPLA